MSEEAGVVDPASDVTAIFFLTGVVASHLPGEWEFVLETGSWSSEVQFADFEQIQCLQLET